VSFAENILAVRGKIPSENPNNFRSRH